MISLAEMSSTTKLGSANNYSGLISTQVQHQKDLPPRFDTHQAIRPV